MSGLLKANPSVSSRQELLDCPPDGDPGVDSENHSPRVSAPRSPQSVGADGSAHSAVFPGATSFQGQLCERGVTQCGHSSMEQDSEQLCGWGALRPRALQVFNSPRWVLFFLSMAFFLQGFIINGLVNTVVTSIERRFEISSSQMGLIVSSYDIACCICLPFVSYFGGSGHKPRWLGLGMGVMGLGSLVFALPHFTTPPYQVTAPERSDMCSSNTTDFSLNKASEGLSNYFYVFVLGQLLHGIGATPLYTLGFTFLDENVKPKNAPVYMGIFYTAAMSGPAIGFLLGGYFLSFYTEITQETELTPASPLWVGAWWIGFILAGTLSLPVAFAILGYPKKLPGSQDTAASGQSEDHQIKDGQCSSASTSQFGRALKDMPRFFLLLLKNPIFMFLSLGVAAMTGLRIMLSTFGPKYFESQFSFSSSQANLIFGAIVIPATGAGTFLGSFIVKRFQLDCRGMTRFCIGCAFFTLLLNLIFLIQCPTGSMAGVTAQYPSGQPDHHVLQEDRTLQNLNRSFVNEELVAQCNANCSCDRELFSPVCGDGVMFYSPCFAGCSSINLTATGEVFTDCSCVSRSQGGLAVAGKCVQSCAEMPVFMTVFTISCFFMLLVSMPPITATLRCVPERQKSFALGIQWILVRTLGGIPAPIVFGSLMDQACLLWQSEGQGSCYLYENSQMSHFTLLTCVVYAVLATVFFFLAFVFCKAPPEPPPNGKSNLHCKTPPEDGAIVKHQTRL